MGEMLIDRDNYRLSTYDIDEALAEACADLGIEDLKSEKQGPWKAALQLVGKRLFPTRKELKDPTPRQTGIPWMQEANKVYDYNILLNIVDYYIMLCNKYTKLISIEGFCYLVNIDYRQIEYWKDTEASSKQHQIYKRIFIEREKCLKDKCYDSSNILGTMSIGNTEYLWNMPGVRNERPQAIQQRTAEQIAQEYGTTAALPEIPN